MKLSRKNWNSYVTRLSAINKTAGKKMQAWINKHGTDNVEALVEYAYALTSKYGEAASAVACQMYDEIAAIQKVHVPPAEPKPTQNIKYVDKAIRSTLDRAPSTVPGTVSEMVKRTGAETTLKNAQRDGAYFAWVPNGDTCAFCITLASNGWRRASKKTINGDHAEHIHKNCDCEFAISFNGPGEIEGYDPDKYLAMYEDAEGASWKDKVNAMRRVQRTDPEVRERINAQQRSAYKARQERRLPADEGIFITVDTREGKEYDIIKPHNLYKNLNKTTAGKKAIELMESNGYSVRLIYGWKDPNTEHGKRTLGDINKSKKLVRIYVDETKTIEETAKTLVHEANHIRDYGDCRKSEVFCEMQASKHQLRRNTLTGDEIRNIMKWAKANYGNLKWKER